MRRHEIEWSVGYVTDGDTIGLSPEKGKPRRGLAAAGHCASYHHHLLLAGGLAPERPRREEVVF